MANREWMNAVFIYLRLTIYHPLVTSGIDFTNPRRTLGRPAEDVRTNDGAAGRVNLLTTDQQDQSHNRQWQIVNG